MESKDVVLHVKFAIASYLDCKIDRSLSSFRFVAVPRIINHPANFSSLLCGRGLAKEGKFCLSLLLDDYLKEARKLSRSFLLCEISCGVGFFPVAAPFTREQKNRHKVEIAILSIHSNLITRVKATQELFESSKQHNGFKQSTY
jgi:hypothetical protein